jgi:hypothetical protein
VAAERRWVAGVVLAASSLALFATSPARWSVAGTITGPTTPAPGRALLVTIDASEEPRISATGFPASFSGAEAPCLDRFVGGKMTCLLPPGAALTRVELRGMCGGCKTCAPPPGAFARADVKETDVWIDGDTSAIKETLPSHAKTMIASRVQVLVSGASFVVVRLVARPRGGGLPIFNEQQSCSLDATSTKASCTFLIYDSALGTVHDVDLGAEATGYGACAAKGCAPPGTIHVDAVSLLP